MGILYVCVCVYMNCTVYNVHCTMYTVQCTLYNVQCTLYNVHCTMYTVQCTLYNVHCTMYNVHCTMYTSISGIIYIFTNEYYEVHLSTTSHLLITSLIININVFVSSDYLPYIYILLLLLLFLFGGVLSSNPGTWMKFFTYNHIWL